MLRSRPIQLTPDTWIGPGRAERTTAENVVPSNTAGAWSTSDTCQQVECRLSQAADTGPDATTQFGRRSRSPLCFPQPARVQLRRGRPESRLRSAFLYRLPGGWFAIGIRFKPSPLRRNLRRLDHGRGQRNASALVSGTVAGCDSLVACPQASQDTAQSLCLSSGEPRSRSPNSG